MVWKVKVMVEKGINFIFCLGSAYDISIMEGESMVEKGISFIFFLGTAYDISMHGKYWEL